MDQPIEPIIMIYKTPEYIRKASHEYRVRQRAINEEEYHIRCREYNRRAREKRKANKATISE